MSRPRPRPLRRRPLLAGLGLLVGLAGLFVAPPATAASPSPSPSPSPSASGTLALRLDQLTPQVLSLGQDLHVAVTVTNNGASAIPRGTVSLELRRVRLATRQDLTSWSDGTTSAAGMTVLARAQLGAPLAAGQSVAVPLDVAASAVQLANVWGPRGLLVRLTTPDGGAQLRTFLLWDSTEQIPQAQVALVAPVVGPPGDVASGGTAPADQRLAALVSAHGRLDRVLQAAQQVPELGLGVDPALLATARAGGQTTAAWADSLTTLLTNRRDAIALPWQDPDAAALGKAGRADLLTAARAASTAALPALSGDLVWTGPGDLDAATALAVRQAGATRVLVPGVDQPSGAVRVARTTAGDVTVLRADARLGELAGGTDAGSPAAQLESLAILAVAARDDAGGDRVLVATDRDWSPDPASVARYVAALRAAPWVRLVTTADLVTVGRQLDARLPTSVAAPAGLLGSDDVRALTDAWVRLHAFAAATAQPAVVTADVDPLLAAPLAVGYRTTPTARQAQVTQALAAVDQRLSAVSLTPRADITAISSSNEVRFVVRNDLTTPATVRVQVTPAKACLSTATSAPVVVPPLSQAAVPVRLLARANCQVNVSAVLVGTDGTPLSVHPLQFHARLSPTIENVATAIVGALLAVGLVLGVWRTVRRGQSGRRGARLEPAEGVPPLPVLGGEVPVHVRDEPPGPTP